MAYAKAPITEAILEFVFTTAVSRSAVESAARRLESRYPQKDNEETGQFEIPALGASSIPAKWTWAGLKLNSVDRADIVVFRPDRIMASRLAPYCGWDTFIERAMDAFANWKKSAGALEIKRVGLRYVNRIDVPISTSQPLIQIEEYLNILPKAPAIFTRPMSGYTVQMTRELGQDECTASITSASVASPLINHASFALDIDVFREGGIPRREEEVWEFVTKLRQHKNAIFEASITDKARALFQ